MRFFEKTIKYVATAVAALLAVAIVVSILNVALFFFGGISGNGNKFTDFSGSYSVDDIKSITLDNSISNVNIVSTTDSEITVKCKNVYEAFKCSVNSKGILTIDNSGSKHGFLSFHRKRSGKITIYIPEKYKIGVLNLDCGVGNIKIQDISMNKLIIDGGVGNTKLTSCLIETGDFDMGVGNIRLNDCILYDAEIDGGVGNMNININGDINDYSFAVDGGIGTVRINGEKPGVYSDNKGHYKIKCDSGVGNIKITIE